MDVMVTGSSGKLGGAACRALASAGHVVVGVDRRPDPGLAGRSVVEELGDPMGVHRAFGRAMEFFGGAPSVVVHLAAHTNTRAATAERVLGENLSMASSVFLASMQYGVRGVVFSSSVQAFLGGMDLPMEMAEESLPRPLRLPIDEGHPARPTNPYGLSKLLTERMLDELCSGREGLLGAEAEVGARLSGVSVRLPYLLNDRAFRWAGGREHRPGYRWGGVEGFAYLHVDDAGELIVRAGEVLAGGGLDGHEVVWACAPDPRHSGSLTEVVEEHYGGVEGAEGAVAAGSLHDCSKAARLFGWEPRRLLREARAGAV